MSQGDGKDLIRTASGVVATLSVNNVEEVTALLRPEPSIERFPDPPGLLLVLRCRLVALFGSHPTLCQTKSVVPERIDFHGLASSRRYHPPVDLRVHPGELIALGSLTQQAV